ncbi:hypothetical protein, partial [Burkholderia gladioli]|uniref:hypothetical protein n=1 Tax=Burkholderia gladioli TaxID=28095 RepID=UPI002B23F760
GLFQNPDDLAFRESGRLHAKFPVDPAARKFYLEHPLILGGTTEWQMRGLSGIDDKQGRILLCWSASLFRSIRC